MTKTVAATAAGISVRSVVIIDGTNDVTHEPGNPGDISIACSGDACRGDSGNVVGMVARARQYAAGHEPSRRRGCEPPPTMASGRPNAAPLATRARVAGQVVITVIEPCSTLAPGCRSRPPPTI